MHWDEHSALILSLYEAVLDPARCASLAPVMEATRESNESVRTHVALASRIRERLAALGSSLDAQEAMLGRLSYGLLWLDDGRRVLGTNPAADRIVARRDGLIVRMGRLRAVTRTAEEELATGFARVAAPGARADATRFLRIERAPEPAYTVLLTPILHLRSDQRRAHASVLVVIADPSAPIRFAEESLRQLFGLPPSLARLATAIANGTTLSAYATSAGVTTGTVRQQMKELLARTGARRQADLVRVILTGVAQLGR